MVSGLRGSRFPPALVVSALPPAGGGAPSYVVPYRGGGVGRGAQPPPPNSPVPAVWAFTCAAACVGAGAAAAAGCAGGSASGRGRYAKPGGASCWRPHP